MQSETCDFFRTRMASEPAAHGLLLGCEGGGGGGGSLGTLSELGLCEAPAHVLVLAPILPCPQLLLEDVPRE